MAGVARELAADRDPRLVEEQAAELDLRLRDRVVGARRLGRQHAEDRLGARLDLLAGCRAGVCGRARARDRPSRTRQWRTSERADLRHGSA